MKRSGFKQRGKPMQRTSGLSSVGDVLKRNRMRQSSAKKRAYEASPEGRTNAAYLAGVRSLPCCACGAVGRTEAHHCRDSPPFDEQGRYEQLPAAGRKSSDRDAIPLCGPGGCHDMFHLERYTFHNTYQRDYLYIPQTRKALEHLL